MQILGPNKQTSTCQVLVRKCIFAHSPLELRIKESRKDRWGNFTDYQLDLKSSGGEDVLGAAKSINKVSGSFLKRHSEWIFLPKQFSVYTSVDGKKYQLLTTQKVAAPKSAEAAAVVKINATKNAKARFVKVVATSTGVCPIWHAGNGGKAWLFCDEISVE